MKQHAVDDREDCGVCPDAQGQCQDDFYSEAGRPAKRAHSVAQIAREVCEPGQTALIAEQLHRLGLTSRFDAQETHGIVLGYAMPGRFGREFDMRAEFFFEIPVAAAQMQRSLETPVPFAKHTAPMHLQVSLCSNVWMMFAIRSH